MIYTDIRVVSNIVVQAQLAYPVQVYVPMTDYGVCASCGGRAVATLEVTRSGYSSGMTWEHADDCVNLRCPHGKRGADKYGRWALDFSCADCNAEEEHERAEVKALRDLVREVAEALAPRVNGANAVVIESLDDYAHDGDAEECRTALRVLESRLLESLPEVLRERVQTAIHEPSS